MIGKIHFRVCLASNANPESQEIISRVSEQAFDPVVSSVAAACGYLEPANRQGDIVVSDQQLRAGNLVESKESRQRNSAFVHIAVRF